ncbi:RHS repeat-associated core domain-containing protein [Pseudomonas putida]|uniref:RHS repeat-associated core domain-containing protein n=1 Tax=Pseudomonas putida TaxID=303 RepID=UPI00049632D5|nr:RHS repeat-associated core domain-containing protein [Pseudomonas putida]
MSQNRKQCLFYKNDHLHSKIDSGRSVTVFSTSNIPLAEHSTETLLLATDSHNSIVKRSHRSGTCNLTYTAYGYSFTAHMMGFSGQRFDDVTNCYLLGNGYRAFSPRLARFYSADSLSPFTKHTHNAYAYCLGDPVNYHDPSGHMLRRLNTVWNSVKNKFVKPRIHYINKAREAITNFPNLEQYSTIVDSPNVTQDTLQMIYRLPKMDAMLAELRDTAVLNWRFKKGNIEGPIIQDFDYLKHLDIDGKLAYIGLVEKSHKYRAQLNNLALASQQTAKRHSSIQLPATSPDLSHPATLRSVRRGS